MKNNDVLLNIFSTIFSTFLIICIVIGMLLVASIPFAFLGMIIASVFNLFKVTDISLTYWNCFILGAAISFVISILRMIFSK